MEAQTLIHCPMCTQKYRVPDSMLGREIQCKKCFSIFTGEPPTAVPPMMTPPPEPTTGTARTIEARRIIVRDAIWFVFGGAMIGFIFTIGYPPGPPVLINYACMFVGALMIGIFAFTMASRRAPLLANKYAKSACVIGCALVACYIWAHFDRYESRWTNENKTRYVDSTYRWSGQIYHRLMSLDGDALYLTSGPMAGQPPRPHGHWTTNYFDKPMFKHEDHWYWFGESISQGEWELRNRK